MLLKWIVVLTQFYPLESLWINNIACEIFPMRNTGNHVRCQGEFPQIESLKDNFQNITETINVFELYNVSIDALPEDIFSDVKNATVRKVIISHSSIELLNIPEFKVSPFASIEGTLEDFEVYQSSSVFAWDVSALASLKKLKNIIIEDSEFIEVKDTFGNFSSLRFIQFLNSSIRWLHPQVFQNNKNLTICSLSNNLISKITRSMFPEPALHLWSLDFSYNKLKSLPKDMFIGMPSLQELKLDNNELRRIDSKLLDPVWNKLSQLWFDGNDAICWALCWIVDKQHKHHSPQFLDSSRCHLRKPIILDSFYKLC